MRVVIAGGHGKIALLLERLLAERGDQAVGLIRNPAHAADVHEAGAEAVLCDLEATSAEDVAVLLAGADAVVFAAGAGAGSGAARKDTVDRAASVLMAGAAERAGVRRFVQVSSMGPAGRRGPAAVRSGLPTSRRRPPPRPICAPGTWTGPSCARAASPMLRPPAGSGLRPRRSPVARSPAPTSPRSLPPCSIIRVPGTRRLSWSAGTARSPRPCTAFVNHGAGARAARITPARPHRLTHTKVPRRCLCQLPAVTTNVRRTCQPLLLYGFPSWLLNPDALGASGSAVRRTSRPAPRGSSRTPRWLRARPQIGI
jgi:putative NAD(P)-binding protein